MILCHLEGDHPLRTPIRDHSHIDGNLFRRTRRRVQIGPPLRCQANSIMAFENFLIRVFKFLQKGVAQPAATD